MTGRIIGWHEICLLNLLCKVVHHNTPSQGTSDLSHKPGSCGSYVQFLWLTISAIALAILRDCRLESEHNEPHLSFAQT